MLLNPPFCRRVYLAACFIFLGLSVNSLRGQSAWTGTDIGTTGATGSYTYSSGTGTLAGAGVGVGGTADSCAFAFTPATGNVEIITKVWSQSNTSNYATAGLMIRQSTAANSPEAYVAVSPTNGVNFTWRAGTGGTSTTTLGPSVATPVWLRLAQSGTSIAGYESPDGVTWTLVGSSTFAISGTFNMGLAVSSNVSGTLSTAVYSPISPMISVPQRTDNMQLWLRGDVGIVLTSTNQVSQWTDQSTNGNNGLQTSPTSRPTFLPNAINGLPDLSFNSFASQNLQLPSGFSDFTSGISVFLVVKPSVTTLDGGYLQLSTGGTGNFIQLAGTGTTTNVNFLFGSTVTSANGLLNQYQLLEAVAGGGTGTIYTNGLQNGQGPASGVSNVLRDLNRVGTIQGHPYQGEIAEVLLYNSALSTADRQNIEVYFSSKYGIAAISPPSFGLPTATYSGSQSLTISGPAGETFYYTTDGSPPTTSSTPYTAPISVVTTTTINAISSLQNISSAASSVTITIDADSAGVSRTGLQLWLYGNAGVVSSGSKVSQWNDQSGLGNNAVQTGTTSQPLLVPNAINSLPSLSFNGTNQYLKLPVGFSDFSAGAGIFVVTKPTNTGSNARFVEFGNGTASNNLMLTRSGTTTGATLFAYSGTTSSSVTGTNALTLNQYQLVEAVHSGNGSAALYTNSQLTGSGTLFNLTGTTRSSNTLAVAGTGTSNFLQGEIVETLVYNTSLRVDQRQAVESYLAKKYAIAAAVPVLATPTLSPAGGSTLYPMGQVVTIGGPTGATLYYTTDGSTPTTASGTYTMPFGLNASGTVKAIAAQTNYTTSAVVTGTYTIDTSGTGTGSGSAGVPRSGLSLWLRADLGVITTGSNVTQWNDQSGNGNNAVQSGTANQPTQQTAQLNGLPVIRFDGSNDYLAVADSPTLDPSTLTVFVVGKFASGGNFAGPFLVKSSLASWLNGYAVTRRNAFAAFYVNSWNDRITTPLAVDTYAIITGQYDLSTATLTSNGTSVSQAYSSTITYPSASLYLGGWGASSPLQGDIAEVLLYGRSLSVSEYLAVQNYLQLKYQLAFPPVVTPVFSNSSGTTFTQPSQVALTIPSIPPSANIYYTTDGSAPTTSSKLYTGPIWVAFTSTIKAFAAAPNYTSSGTVTGTFTLNSGTWPAPVSGTVNPSISLDLPYNTVPHP